MLVKRLAVLWWGRGGEQKAGPATSVLWALIVMKTCTNRTQLYFLLGTSESSLCISWIYIDTSDSSFSEEAKIYESKDYCV